MGEKVLPQEGTLSWGDRQRVNLKNGVRWDMTRREAALGGMIWGGHRRQNGGPGAVDG